MMIEDRILSLNRIKMQLLVSWLPHQEIGALIKSGEQDLEDWVMDNISKEGRHILLDFLKVDPADYEKRMSVVRKVNRLYLERMEKEARALNKEERNLFFAEAVSTLSPEEKELYESRRRFPEQPLSEALQGRISSHLDKLEKGESLNAAKL